MEESAVRKRMCIHTLPDREVHLQICSAVTLTETESLPSVCNCDASQTMMCRHLSGKNEALLSDSHTLVRTTDSKQLPKKVFYPHPHPSVSNNWPAEESHGCLVGRMAGDWEEHGIGRAFRGRKEDDPSLCSNVYCTQRT